MPAQKAKTSKLSDSEQVSQFLAQLQHPFKEEILEVRRIILAANPALTERIKWNAPSFCVNEEDRITFNLHGQENFRLIFHCGAKAKPVKDKQPMFDDHTDLLQWAAPDRAIAAFTDMADVKAKETALTGIVNKWIEVTL